jgi:hypothetical protein
MTKYRHVGPVARAVPIGTKAEAVGILVAPLTAHIQAIEDEWGIDGDDLGAWYDALDAIAFLLQGGRPSSWPGCGSPVQRRG